jgi:para-nitrobenzyl esterase
LSLVEDQELRAPLSSWLSVVELAEDEGHVWDFRDRLRTGMARVGFSLLELEVDVVATHHGLKLRLDATKGRQMRRLGESARTPWGRSIATACVVATGCATPDPRTDSTIGVEQGLIATRAAGADDVVSYLGVPYAAPPVGELRWRPPQPPATWNGVRSADRFGDRCIQTNPFPDMHFQSAAESEDCLTLSIWTKAATDEPLPVMVWIHGGGFFSGSSDEQRHDGSALAERGVVVVVINYRLGALGFLAHPELTAESEAGASGNYGLLDQIAALLWVRHNIASFGGDPDNVTIFGESAGSFSVSALMASPLARGLFHKAIGQSGATRGEATLAKAEVEGLGFADAVGANGLDELRATPPAMLVGAASATLGSGGLRFGPNVDGFVLMESVLDVFEHGDQSDVPLLAGWNSAEVPLPRASAARLGERIREAFPNDIEAASRAYPGDSEDSAWQSAVALQSDQFIGFSTWKWIESHAATATSPTFRYLFNQVRPGVDGPPPEDSPGAQHASDIEYVFGTLESLDVAWSAADRAVSRMMIEAWTNFAASGRPAAAGLPSWEAWHPGGRGLLMRIDASPALEPETHRARYELLDAIDTRQRAGR